MAVLFAAFYFGYCFCYFYGKSFLCCNRAERLG